MAEQFDLVIIGGGIVGLSTALAVTQRHPRLKVAVLEKEDRLAAHQTGHNSGVIHSGIYYKPGSLKAQTCVAGAKALVAFCDAHGIPYERCGKVVVATSLEELPRLEELFRRGVANGVEGIEMIGPERLRELEPYATGIKALHVPTTGIIDFPRVAQTYAQLVQAQGGEIKTRYGVHQIRFVGRALLLDTAAGEIRTRFLINCGGLLCDRIARMAGAQIDLQIVPFRGEYYTIAPHRRSLVKNLIYPVPDPALPFLGVHFTRTIDGLVEAGPNAVLAFAREGYRKTDFVLADLKETLTFPGFWRMAQKYWQTGIGEMYRSYSKAAFLKALQRLLPDLKASDLQPGGSGVRAQAIAANGALVDDFMLAVVGPALHVLNAPSPGATASLAIGQAIMEKATEAFALAE
ncbi:MAG: L-2-hydroxyglutarate oxidase [Deltaproteobacteria bacterium]|nr:L-2-hydroxyglutarate oxidase [Deltaproteobacteria bacterium]